MTTLTARSNEDLLAVVPVVLGFVPTDSVVMLTLSAARPFHARLDLPPPGAEDAVPEVVGALLDPARRHEVTRVAFVLFSDLAGWSAEVADALVGSFRLAGIDVFDALRADGSRWYPLGPGSEPCSPTGTPYDLGHHRFTAQAVLEGKVTHRSRAELAATLRGDPDRIARAGTPVPGARLDPGAARTLVEAHLATGAPLADADAARLLASLPVLPVRDAVWRAIRREDATEHVALWTDLTRRSPETLVPGPASLLAFSAWLAGHGALAWCAVDRCREVAPDHGLAALLARLLERAVPPSEWSAWGPEDEVREAQDASLRTSG